MDFFLIIFFKESKNTAVEKNLRIAINVYKKTMSSSYHMGSKIFIEASCTNSIHTGEKDFFRDTFEGL